MPRPGWPILLCVGVCVAAVTVGTRSVRRASRRTAKSRNANPHAENGRAVFRPRLQLLAAPRKTDVANTGSIPLPVKLAYTGFLCVLVPSYWRSFGPTNFLYFCDIGLFLTLASVWTGRPLPVSMAAAGLLLPQVVWLADVAATAAGRPLVGMTNYMFEPNVPPFDRGLSTFHGWLPFFLWYLLGRLGYDRRAFVGWTLLAWTVLPICYFLLPAPPASAGDPNLPVNVNFVYGLSNAGPQTWLPGWLWLLLQSAVMPLFIFLPAHLVLRTAFEDRSNEAGGPVRRLPSSNLIGVVCD